MPWRKKCAFLIFYFLHTISVWAQVSSSDSLQIVQAINQSFALHCSHPDSAFQIAEVGLQLAEKAKDTVSLINLWRIKSLVRYRQHDMENTLNFVPLYD